MKFVRADKGSGSSYVNREYQTVPYNNQLVAMAEVANSRLASRDELFISTFQVALITGQRDAVIVATYEQDPLMPVITL